MKAQKDLSEASNLELADFQDWIQKYRQREIGDIKMQKIRLQLGTYAQRQDGVQMQRIKLPGGVLSSNQLIALAEAAEKYGSGFLHFTTRQDAQIYYIQLENCPDMMRGLAAAGITTREACGNTVRNITICYRSGISAEEIFDVTPYGEALTRYLLRNKFNQVMGRKFKIAFEGCSQDHAGMRFHDIGFQAQIRNVNGIPQKGFRIYLGGGLGAVPILGELYTDFLPVDEMFRFASAILRLFDRYGERKNRMSARMKFLIKKMTWPKFKEALEKEIQKVHPKVKVEDYLDMMSHPERSEGSRRSFVPPHGATQDDDLFLAWKRDNVIPHAQKGYQGVLIRLRLGDLLSPQAKEIAKVAFDFSSSQLRVTPDQNLFLPWVQTADLSKVFLALQKLELAESGAETLEDTTTCPGADTCRLGITSAKGLGSAISDMTRTKLTAHQDLLKDIKVKISGCPNGCAQHAVAQIGFQGAALTQDGKTVPANELYLGGQVAFDQTTYGERAGKFPSRNCPAVVETLVKLYANEKKSKESFSECLTRIGKDRIKDLLAPLAAIPSFMDAPEYYQDWGHANEKFAIRSGIKGECAGSPIQEKHPVFETADEKRSQAEAFFAHEDYTNARIQAVEAIAAAARVPLYAVLVDPFTDEQVLWEFDNLFVLTDKAKSEWSGFSEKIEEFLKTDADEKRVRKLLDLSESFIQECRRLCDSLAAGAPKPT